MLPRQPLHLVVVDLARVGLDAILRGLEQLAGKIHFGAVRQVAAMVEAHAENRIAGVEQRQIHRGVRLRARMRLNVRVRGAEQFFGSLDRQGFRHVDVFAAAVVALAGIAFRVFVGEHRALRLEHARAGVVFRGDQLDVVFLAFALAGDRLREFWIETGNRHFRIEHEMDLAVDSQ